MHIPSDLPQFLDAPALLLVCGTQEAKVYYALNGAIDPLDVFRVPHPSFTDHEGHGERRGHGMSIVSGGGQEINEAQQRHTFVRQLGEHVARVTVGRSVQLVYLFVPEHAHREIRDALPHDLLPKIAKEIHGNYCELHPHELVRMISSSFS